MHRTLTALALAAAALVAACGSDKAAGPTNVSASGTWNLQTVNGSPLPFTAYQSASGDTLRILGDVFYANPSGTFTDTTSVQIISGGQTTNAKSPDAGTWTSAGSQVTWKFASDSSTVTGTINGGAMTIVGQSSTLVYKKQ